MRVEVLTIFPEMLQHVFGFGMIRQALRKGLLDLEVVDLRAFTTDRHRTVDDRPYGGGEGMVLKPEPIFAAVESLHERAGGSNSRVVLLSPRGELFDQEKAKELSLQTRLTLICGRYEGVDQRVSDHLADAEISIGDFVLSGGELAAAIIVESVTRLIPEVLGEGQSVLRESFMEGLLDCPHYTRPASFEGLRVPEVLLGGDHKAIESWRREQAEKATRERRPDLLDGTCFQQKE